MSTATHRQTKIGLLPIANREDSFPTTIRGIGRTLPGVIRDLEGPDELGRYSWRLQWEDEHFRTGRGQGYVTCLDATEKNVCGISLEDVRK